MKKQLLTLMIVAFLSNASFALNKAINTYSSGYGATATSPLTGVSAFTFETWFNGAPGTTYARLISFSSYAFEIAGGAGTISIYDGAWRATGVTGMGTGWHHVAVTNDLTNFIVYVDGVQVYTKAAVARDFTGQIMNVGHDAKNHTANQRFPGKFDEVRVWNRALSALEIAIVKTKQALGTENGLVVYYDFNNGTGTNKVSNTHHLSLASNPAIITTNYIDYIKDWGMSYDGTDDKTYITSPITGSGNFTFEMQFKTTSTNSSPCRLISYPSYQLEIGIANGVIKSYLTSGSWVAGSGSGYNDGEWHHLAVVRTTNTITIYVDGNLESTRNIAVNLSSYMYIGGTSSHTDHFTGTLDEIRFWNIARTQPEIEAAMNGELAGTESGLIGYFDFNTPTGATNITNMVTGGAALTRFGSTGANNYPQFAAATKNLILSTGISEIFAAEKEVLSVYPNPVNDVLNINTNGASQIIVLDAAGKEVMNVTTTSSQIDLSALNQGIYFLQVLQNDTIKTAKIIKD